MIFRHMASPMPVPGYVARSCSRWKITKIRSAYSALIPMPLSATANSQEEPSGTAVTLIRGGASPRNLTALLSRFWKTAVMSGSCAETTGSGPAVTVAPVCVSWLSRFACAAASAAAQETGPVSPAADRPTLLNASRSLISTCIRVAPSTANSMYWSARSSSWPPYRRRSSWQKLVTFRSGSWRSCDAT